MSLSQPKKVNYSANERLDLVDKMAELSTADDNQAQVLKALVSDSPDGRVFSGWRTTTANGANSGFSIAAEPAAALDRAGNVLILDGSAALTVPLSQNTINYVHAYYAETASDPDTRRFFSSGSETVSTTFTRLTRTPNLYKTTASYGTGVPSFSGFSATATIAGNTTQLLPLYAVAVDNTNTVTSVVDYRPMFAPDVGTAGNNQYETASGHADLPFNFAPATNAATLGIGSIRQALLALADRIKEIKGSTHWYDASLNQWQASLGTGELLTGANLGLGDIGSTVTAIGFYGSADGGFNPTMYPKTKYLTIGSSFGYFGQGVIEFDITDLASRFPNKFLSYQAPNLTLGNASGFVTLQGTQIRLSPQSGGTISAFGSMSVAGTLTPTTVSVAQASNYVLSASGSQTTLISAYHGVPVAGTTTFSSSGMVMAYSTTSLIPVAVPAGAVITGYQLSVQFLTANGVGVLTHSLTSTTATSPNALVSTNVFSTSNGTYSTVNGSSFSTTVPSGTTCYTLHVATDSQCQVCVLQVAVQYTVPSIPVSFVH